MAISQLYPNQRPTLNLNFARSKTLDSRITFSRGGCAGTYVGSNGLIKTAAVDEPRFDHDPVTGDCRGLLIEELRENFNNQSENFSVYNEHPSAGLTVRTANAGIAPDGTNTAFKIYPSGSQPGVNDRCWIFRNLGNLNIASGTNSVFAKADGKRYMHVFTVYGGYGAQFDLQDGVVTSTHDASITATIEDYGNGWYRCSASDSETSTFNQLGLYVSDSATGADVVPSGSGGTDGILIWGYQTEEGLFPTSYMPTSGSTCTRNADLCIIRNNTWLDIWNTSGSKTIVCEGLNSTYSSEGAVNGQGPLMFNITYPYLGQLKNFNFYLNGSNRNPVVTATSPAVLNYHNNAIPGNDDPAFFRGAVTFQLADNRIPSAFNGTIATSESKQSSAGFILNKLNDPASNLNDNALRIGGQNIGTDNWRWNGPISKFAIYNAEVSTETLESLTR